MYVYLEILRVADEVLEVKSVLTKKKIIGGSLL